MYIMNDGMCAMEAIRMKTTLEISANKVKNRKQQLSVQEGDVAEKHELL